MTDSNTFKHQFELFYYLFSPRRPTHKLCFLSCGPFVVNETFSTGFVAPSVFWPDQYCQQTAQYIVKILKITKYIAQPLNIAHIQSIILHKPKYCAIILIVQGPLNIPETMAVMNCGSDPKLPCRSYVSPIILKPIRSFELS